MKLPHFRLNYYLSTLILLFIPLLLLWLSRFAFAFYNADLTGNPSFGRMLELSVGGLRFDLCAWAYFNSVFIVMRFLPLRFVTSRAYLTAGNVIYLLTNTVMLALSLADIPFFRFTGSRLRIAAITDMLHDPNIGGIILSYISGYWWAFLGVALIAVLLWCACRILSPQGGCPLPLRSRPLAATGKLLIFAAVAFLTFCAMRGSLGPGKPIAIPDAIWYAATPPETNIVLNTPFCILRSAKGGDRLPVMEFMSPKEAEQLHRSLHTPRWPADSFTRKNVMLITIESGSQHWLDRLNDVPGATPRHLMPFLDSLSSVSLVNRHVLATGKRSIEGITAIYGGFPTFGEMLYMSSPYNANRVDSHARVLKSQNYSSRFYFGGNHGSYSIDALAKAMGYDDVADRDTYNNDADFNGSWGIHDHAMAAYAARDLSSLKEPFVSGWFTLDLHEPFATPTHWRPDGYLNPNKGLLKSAEYTDRSIRHFFEIARTQPWYNNTIFIITGDHGCRDLKDTPYDSPYVQPHVMFLVYAPDGSIAPGEISDRVMSQFDIGASILGLLHFPRPYISVGTDMTDPSASHYSLGFFNGQYQVTGTKYLITLSADARSIDKVYDIVADPVAHTPLTSYDKDETKKMLLWAQAFLQDYTLRMNRDQLHLH